MGGKRCASRVDLWSQYTIVTKKLTINIKIAKAIKILSTGVPTKSASDGLGKGCRGWVLEFTLPTRF